jgi:hypothetical protein
MQRQRKFWLIAVAAILALSIIACGINTVKPTPTVPPTMVRPTQPPLPTPEPTLAPIIPLGNFQDMIGSWLDPDTNGDVTTIFGLEGGLAVDSVINPDDGSYELTDQKWDGAVLSWTYCVTNGPCVSVETTGVDGDALYTNWSNDNGDSGSTTLTRVTDDTQGGNTGVDWSLLAGHWLDPDTTGTITTIEAKGDGYEVVSVMNPGRGVNELTESKWENGVLSWTYCPESMHCIVSSTVSVDETTLAADWGWADGGNGGTTYFVRQP